LNDGVVLACDFGATSSRAALLDGEGRILRKHAAGSAAPAVAPDGAEIEPVAWWLALVGAVEALSEDAAFAHVRAIAVAGVTRTQILLGRDGLALRPAMTWQDARAEPLSAEIAAALPNDHPEAGSVNAFHPIARLFWLKRHEPDVLDRIAAVVEPKDYLNFRLTGQVATDPISSARLLASALPGPRGPSLLDSIGLPASVLPRPLDPTAIVGRVAAGLPSVLAGLSGLPVLTLSHDTWAAVVGLGALRDGGAYNLSGTTEVFGVLSAKAATAEGLMSVPYGEGLHQLGGPSQNGGDTLVWALSLLSRHGGDPLALGPELDALLGDARDKQPLLFLPYLKGERTPYWDPGLRGAFVGLNRRHRAVDCAFAALEGVAFLNRIVLERAEEALDRRVDTIRFGGGGAANEAWCQIKADVCRRPLLVTEASEPGLLGAAIVAWRALGAFPTLGAGQDRLVRVARRFEPRPDAMRAYDGLFALYRETEGALAPISKALAAFRSAGPSS
jgi:xylulokinase